MTPCFIVIQLAIANRWWVHPPTGGDLARTNVTHLNGVIDVRMRRRTNRCIAVVIPGFCWPRKRGTEGLKASQKLQSRILHVHGEIWNAFDALHSIDRQVDACGMLGPTVLRVENCLEILDHLEVVGFNPVLGRDSSMITARHFQLQ